MRKFTRMLTCLLALVVAVGLCVPALAVNADESPLYLSATPDAPALGYEVTVQIGAKEDGLVADGKLIVTYDPAVLRYEGASLGQAWDHHPDVTMADNDQNGKVIIAFAGIDAAKAGCLVELTFVCKKIGTATVSLDGSSTLTGFTGTDLSDKVSFQVRESELLSVTFREDPSGKIIEKVYVPYGYAAKAPEAPARKGSYFVGWDRDFSCVTENLDVFALYCDGSDCPMARFIDCDPSRYYHEGVDYVLEEGLMIGLNDTTFDPQGTMTRGMMVMVLYRLAGTPEVSGDMPFTDVSSGRYYYNAVKWAANQGITKGTTADTFEPNAPVTREQVVTFLYRYANYAGLSTYTYGNLDGFTDVAEISRYAVTPMAWAVENGIVNGVTATELCPKGQAQRCQIAKILKCFDDAFVN